MKPKRWLYWKTEKEKCAQRMEAWNTRRELMLNPDTPAHVRLAAAGETLERIDGKVPAQLQHTGEDGGPISLKWVE